MTITYANHPQLRDPGLGRVGTDAWRLLRDKVRRAARRARPRAATDLALLLVLVPPISLALFAAGNSRVEGQPALYGVIVVPTVLIATVLVYASWRIAPTIHRGWVSAAVIMIGVQTLATLATQLLSDELGRPQVLASVATLTCLAGLLALAGKATRRPVPRDPVLVGVAAGAALALARLVGLAAAHLGTPVPGRWSGIALMASLVVVCCALVHRTHGPAWARARIAAVVVLLSSGAACLHLAGDASWGPLGVMAGHAGAGVVVASLALAGMRLALADDEAQREDLRRQLTQAEVGRRQEQAVRHEINATLAGIRSASQLVHTPENLSVPRRQRLEGMIDAELSRLARLLDPTRSAPVRDDGPVELDQVIETLALAQEARGATVEWSPSDLGADADADQVAEIVNILLDNAVKHGGQRVSVSMAPVGDRVTVAVTDFGPGVCPEMRDAIFQWGTKAPDSGGQGIGLPVARELAERQDGDLSLRESTGTRTTFVLALPAASPAAGRSR